MLRLVLSFLTETLRLLSPPGTVRRMRLAWARLSPWRGLRMTSDWTNNFATFFVMAGETVSRSTFSTDARPPPEADCTDTNVCATRCAASEHGVPSVCMAA
eukprot:6208663-Pleurochrysis_carterae.AAC.3